MRSTFKLLFHINRNKVKSDGTTAVLCRISIDGKKSAVATGIYCRPEDWDSKKCEIRTVRENNRLAGFRDQLEKAYDNGSPDKPGGLSIQLCKSEKKEFYIRYSS